MASANYDIPDAGSQNNPICLDRERPENIEQSESRKRRYADYVQSQKSLFDTGKFSDFVVTCHGREWKVHKAVVCTQSSFFDAASRFGKEAAESKVDLPEDDPDMIEHLLRFMYECDYHISHDHVLVPPNHCSVSFDWQPVTDRLSRKIRRMLAEGINKLNHEGMKRAVQLVHDWGFHDFNGTQDAFVRSDSLSRNHILLLVGLFKNNQLTDGAKFYDYSRMPLIVAHAKLYCLGDKYDVKGLQETAKGKLEHAVEGSLCAASQTEHIYEAFRVILQGTPDSDRNVRDWIAVQMWRVINAFGISPVIQSLFEDCPELAIEILKLEHADNKSHVHLQSVG